MAYMETKYLGGSAMMSTTYVELQNKIKSINR